jgi:hypothetical protein
MKIIYSLFLVVAFLSFISEPLTEKERKEADKFLTESEKEVFKTVDKLTDAQLTFKAAPDKWSVQDCMYHIAATEKGLWGMVSASLKDSAHPEKRKDIKWTDEDVKKNIEDRSNKVKTSTQLEPQNTGFKTMAEATASFKENRDKLINFVKTTPDDLRNHITTMPFGPLDDYQMVLFIGAHTNRHVKQMKEVMADPNFPKK